MLGQSLLDVYTAIVPRLEQENGSLNPSLLALGDFPFAVDVPGLTGQKFQHVWARLADFVPDGVGRANGRLPPLVGWREAQQADDVAFVGVERLPEMR